MNANSFRLAAFLAAAAATLPHSASAALVHQWSFDGDLLDTSGSGNHGTLNGGDATEDYVPGKSGQALDINSAEGVIKTSASNLPLLGSDAWTINVWLKLDTAAPDLTFYAGFGNQSAFTGAPEHGQSRGLINLFGPNINFWGLFGDAGLANPDIATGTGYIADGDWHMYTVTNDGSDISIFRDAAVIATGANNLLDTTFDQVAVGNPAVWGSTARFGIDEFTIWDTALTQSQINSLVPEPSTAALGVMSLIALATRRRT